MGGGSRAYWLLRLFIDIYSLACETGRVPISLHYIHFFYRPILCFEPWETKRFYLNVKMAQPIDRNLAVDVLLKAMTSVCRDHHLLLNAFTYVNASNEDSK